MTDKQKLAKLEQAEALLKKTTNGYTPAGQYWKPAMALINEVQADLRTPVLSLVFPIAAPHSAVFVGGLHETDGLPGYWALDFICKAGLGIVAPERGTITKFSGHDPTDDGADSIGAYGWSTYITTPAGYVYYATHQGRRYPTLRVGMKVQPGDLIGYVGDQRFRPDHLHLGVHSPKGEADAKARITAVSKAPSVS